MTCKEVIRKLKFLITSDEEGFDILRHISFCKEVRCRIFFDILINLSDGKEMFNNRVAFVKRNNPEIKDTKSAMVHILNCVKEDCGSCNYFHYTCRDIQRLLVNTLSEIVRFNHNLGINPPYDSFD